MPTERAALPEQGTAWSEIKSELKLVAENDFDWRIRFSEVFKNGGFDIVISNPPYISHDAIINKPSLETRYECYEPYADLFCYFIEFVHIKK